MLTEHQLRILVNPEGPLSYEQVREYLISQGFQKPGKGMKHLITTMLQSGYVHNMIKDLTDKAEIIKQNKPERKKPGPKKGLKRQKTSDASFRSTSNGNVSDNENDAKKDDGNDTVDIDVERRLNEALALRGKTFSGALIRRVKRLLDAIDEEDAEEEVEHDNVNSDLFGPNSVQNSV